MALSYFRLKAAHNSSVVAGFQVKNVVINLTGYKKKKNSLKETKPLTSDVFLDSSDGAQDLSVGLLNVRESLLKGKAQLM